MQSSVINAHVFVLLCGDEEAVDSALQSFNPYRFGFHAVSSNGVQHRGAARSMARHGMVLPSKSLLATVCL